MSVPASRARAAAPAHPGACVRWRLWPSALVPGTASLSRAALLATVTLWATTVGLPTAAPPAFAQPPAATTPAAATGPLSQEPCRLVTPLLPAAFERCGYVTVPVNPEEPDGATIELFVARAAAATASPAPEPLLIITGGPGGSTIDFWLQSGAAFESARLDRDLILVDQRGTGRSSAGFECEVPEDLTLETAGEEALGRFVDACLAALEHDPRYYTTSIAVRDLERVRVALGIEQWNVYGVSYGTRVAQHYLRRYPERVRALVLDGVVPPEMALGPDIARVAQNALDGLFARCAAAATCAQRFPELPAHFAALLERLEASPVDNRAALGASDEEAARDPRFTADHLRAVARFMSYNATTAALLPVLFEEAYEGRYRPLVAQASTTLRGLPESLSFPMSNSVVCAEDAPYIPADAAAGLKDTYLGTTIVDALRQLCARWPRGIVDDDLKAPLASRTPTLLLSGENDPVTPPAYAERAAAGLANSRHLVGRGQGHGLVVIGCTPRLLRAFLANTDPEGLDAACLERELPMPFFISLLGPSP